LVTGSSMGNILSDANDAKEEPNDAKDEPTGKGEGYDTGVFAVQDKLLIQEKRVAEMETSSMLLDEYQQQLDGIANQSMLLLGFVMATIGVDTLSSSGDISSGFCFSKSPAHYALTLCLFVTTELCICFCLLCICACAYTLHTGRHAFLHIGWLIFVHRTEKSVRRIYRWYFLAGSFFVLSLLFLIWLFVGIDHLPQAPDSASDDSDAVVVTQNGRRLLVGCFDPTDDDELERHNWYGRGIAITFTVVMALMVFYTYYSYRKAQQSCLRDQAQPDALLLRRRREVYRMNWHMFERRVGRINRDLEDMEEEREEFLLDNPGLHWRHVEESEGSGVPSQMKLDNPEFAKALHKKHAEGKKKLEFSQAELNELMGAKRQSLRHNVYIEFPVAGDRTEKFAPEQHKRELQKLADRLGVCPAQADDARPRKAQEQEKRNFDVFRDILHEHGLAAAKRWWEAELLNEQLEVCGKTSDKSLHEDIRTAFGKAGKQSDELWKETQNKVTTKYNEPVTCQRYMVAAPRAMMFREKRPRSAGRVSKMYRKTPGDVARRIEAKKEFDDEVREAAKDTAASTSSTSLSTVSCTDEAEVQATPRDEPQAEPRDEPQLASSLERFSLRNETRDDVDEPQSELMVKLQELQEFEEKRKELRKQLDKVQKEAADAHAQWQKAVDEEKARKHSERSGRKEASRALKVKERQGVAANKLRTRVRVESELPQ